MEFSCAETISMNFVNSLLLCSFILFFISFASLFRCFFFSRVQCFCHFAFAFLFERVWSARERERERERGRERERESVGSVVTRVAN